MPKMSMHALLTLKAHDQVPHEKLLGVLQEYSVDHPVSGREIIVFLLRSLCQCQRNYITTLRTGCWT